MKREEFKKDGYEYIIENYESIDELLTTLDKRTLIKGATCSTTRTSTDSWSGETYEDAIKYLKYGDNRKIDVVMKKFKQAQTSGSNNKLVFENDVVGFQPIIPNAIQGLPLSMINSRLKPKKQKVVTIRLSLNVVSHVSSDAVYNFGSKVIEKVVQLEKSGFRVRVELSYINYNHNAGQMLVVNIPLKKENQPLDLKKLVFPMSNVAFQRRIIFDWYDRTPGVKYDCCYGRSLSACSSDIKKKVLKTLVGDRKDLYMILYGDNLDETFKSLR